MRKISKLLDTSIPIYVLLMCYLIYWSLSYALFRYYESGCQIWYPLKETPQRALPFALFLLQPWKRYQTFEKHKTILTSSLMIITIAWITLFYNSFLIHWRISAIAEWAFAGFALLLLYDYKVGNWFFSLFLASESVIAGGIYYELPTLPYRSDYTMIGVRFPFLISTSILALPLLLYGLTFLKFKTSKPFWVSFIIYAVYSLAWLILRFPNPNDFMRLPMIAVLLAIPLCLERVGKSEQLGLG
jgi:hypothetical protein